MKAAAPEDRDRDASRRPRSARPRDALGRPLEHGASGVERLAEGRIRTPAETLAEAERLMAAGLPFHAHEVFEDAWKSAPAADQEMWRGLAQVAVGATHAARGNRRGALALLRRGAATLAPYRDAPSSGVDVAAVLGWVAESMRRVEMECPVMLPAPSLIAPPSS